MSSLLSFLPLKWLSSSKKLIASIVMFVIYCMICWLNYQISAIMAIGVNFSLEWSLKIKTPLSLKAECIGTILMLSCLNENIVCNVYIYCLFFLIHCAQLMFFSRFPAASVFRLSNQFFLKECLSLVFKIFLLPDYLICLE